MPHPRQGYAEEYGAEQQDQETDQEQGVAQAALGAAERERRDLHAVANEHESQRDEGDEETGVSEPPVRSAEGGAQPGEGDQQQHQRHDRHEPVKGGDQVGWRPKPRFVQADNDGRQRE
jgi:hypothetical protein